MWQKASGYLDGSARYQITDNIELSLDVSNILNTTAVTQQQVFGDSTLTPGREAGEDRFGLGAQRSALPARRAVQVLTMQTSREGAPLRVRTRSGALLLYGQHGSAVTSL